MRIEIDTVNKTIVVLSHTSMKELVEKLPEMVKNWEEYTLISKVEYSSMPYIYQYPFQVNPAYQPLTPPFFTTCVDLTGQQQIGNFQEPTISIN